MHRVLVAVIVIVVAFIITIGVIWVAMSYSIFERYLPPGSEYTIGGRAQKIPLLPHMIYKSDQEPSLERPVPILYENTLVNLRSLIIDTLDVLREEGMESCVLHGSLISAMLWKQLMSYDDDFDVLVDWLHRDRLYSTEFLSVLDSHGLERILLHGQTGDTVTQEGSLVRIRRKGVYHPTVDVGFIAEVGDGRIGQVSRWTDGVPIFEKEREMFPPDWIHPIKQVDVDGMTWGIPNKPRDMLNQNYGEEWETILRSPQPMTNTHKFAFWISHSFGAWTNK